MNAMNVFYYYYYFVLCLKSGYQLEKMLWSSNLLEVSGSELNLVGSFGRSKLKISNKQ